MTWAPDYTTAAQLKSYLRIDSAADDAFIAAWITTVSRNVDDYCGRQFGQVATAEARTYTPVWDRHLGKFVAEIDDIQDTTGFVVVDSNGYAVPAHSSTVDGYTLQPVNAPAKGNPYERLHIDYGTGDITPTGLWGRTAVPAAVTVGVYLQGARLAARRDSPFGISGSPSEQGEIRLLAQLDPDLRTALAPLRRSWWCA